MIPIRKTLLVSGMTLALMSSALAAPPQQKDPKQVYLDKCSVCHGEDGAGKTAKGKKLKVKDVRSPEILKVPAAERLNILLKGKGDDMDGFEKELGADLCKKVLDYMMSLAK